MPDTEAKIAFSRAELIRIAREYTARTYPDNPNTRHERLGMLVDFIGGLLYDHE